MATETRPPSAGRRAFTTERGPIAGIGWGRGRRRWASPHHLVGGRRRGRARPDAAAARGGGGALGLLGGCGNRNRIDAGPRRTIDWRRGGVRRGVGDGS